MPDIPMGWATLIAAAVTAAGGMAAIVISIVLGARTRRAVKNIASDTREVKEQVTNSHTTNLRDESDHRHNELISEITAVISEITAVRATQDTHGERLDEVQRTQRGMQRDIGRLADADQEHTRTDHRLSERLTDIEKNNPRPHLPEGES